MSRPSPTAEAPARGSAAAKQARTVRAAVVVGTSLEHYDFFLFGTAAALVFNHQFFVTDNPLVATLASFVTLAVGFAARPLGAIIFGHLGDTLGRRKTLIFTLILIGCATGLIGLLPNYLQIGVLATILLTVLRILQGLSFGGEWAGAVTLALEHAPKGKESRYAVLPQLGSPIGNIMSSAAFILVGFLPHEAFSSWGWRLPFLAAFPLLLIALWIRVRLEETPAFERVAEEQKQAKVPLAQVFRHSTPQVLIGAAVAMLSIGGFFLVTTFTISYGTGVLGLPSSVMLTGSLLAAALQIVTVFVSGALAERFGPTRVALWASIVCLALVVPFFLLLDTAVPALVILAMVIMVQPMGVTYAVGGQILPSLFPTAYRYSGTAISFNIAGMLGGFAPMIATGLLLMTDEKSWSLMLFLALIVLTTLVGSILAGRRRAYSFREDESAPAAA